MSSPNDTERSETVDLEISLIESPNGGVSSEISGTNTSPAPQRSFRSRVSAFARSFKEIVLPALAILWEELVPKVIKNNYELVLAFLSKSALFVGGIFIPFLKDHPWLLFFLIILLVGFDLFVTVNLAWKAKSVAKLESEIRSLCRLGDEKDNAYSNMYQSYRRSLDGVLEAVSKQIGIGGKGRISIYRHRSPDKQGKPGDGEFLMLGRWAQNPKFNCKGRGIYPDNQGAIAKAYWSDTDGTYESVKLPSPGKNGTVNKGYLNFQERTFDIDNATVRGFKMLSTKFFAVALRHRSSRNRIAVCVVESTSVPNNYDLEKIRSCLETGILSDSIRGYIERIIVEVPGDFQDRTEGESDE